MERLIAWYRIGSSVGAVVALIVANAIPLFGVLFLGWNVWTILTIYWLENGVVGVLNILKMARAAGPEPTGRAAALYNGRPVGSLPDPKAVLIPFFIVHYGIFWVVHGIFVLTLPQFQAFGDESAGLTSDPGAVLIVLGGLFISHYASYRLNYIGRGEYLRTSVSRQMGAPYGRLFVLHLTILVGGMAIAFTGASSAAVLILVLLKTGLDLGLHLNEHREAECRSGQPSRLPVGPEVARVTASFGMSKRVTRVVSDPRFERLVPDGTPITPHAGGARWAEGPVYVPDEDAVLWSDVRSNAVRRWSDADGDSVLFQPSDFANGHTLDHDGTVLACEHGLRRIARYERDGSRTTVVDRFGGARFNSPNDIVVASDGAIWFTDPPYGILDDSEGYKADSEQDGCFVYRLDRASGEVTVASRELVHPNGLAFSPDERTMYVSDTSVARIEGGNHHILAFDVVDGRRLDSPRVFLVMEPGVSDGMRVDVEGNVWTSAGDGIHVLDASGSSWAGSSCRRRPATASSAARTAGGCTSPRPRHCGRCRSGSAGRSRHGWTRRARR